jgi:RNA polymerase primary sigma factor
MGDEALYSDDPLRVYLREVGKVPSMDRDEEIKCIEHARASGQLGEAERTRLVEAHLHHVVSLAEVSQTGRIYILDLIEQGNNGLLEAVDKLNTCTQDSFWPFARVFVERAIAQAHASGSPSP